jgi:hypothetical protein
LTLAAVEKQPDRAWGGLLRRPWIVVVGVALVAAIFRIWAAFEIPLPWIMTDELIFRELATSFGRTGHFFVRGESIGLVSLYPVVLAPLWRAGSVALSFDLSKVLNVVAMTASSLLVYAWARRLVSTPYALATFALTLVMPAVLYTSELMSENLAMPAFVLSAFAIWRALQQPTWTNQAWALGSIVLVCAVRAQGVVLIPIWATAIALSAVLSTESVGRWRGVLRAFRAYWPSAAAIAALAGGYLLITIGRGKSLLGFYEGATSSPYSAERLGQWIVYHLAELSIAVGLIPAAALIVMLASAGRHRTAAPIAALLAVTTASVVWLVALSGTWASWYADGIRERYEIYAVPLVLMTFAVFLERNVTRRVWVLVAAVAACLLPIALPFSTLFRFGVLSKAPSLDSLFWLSARSADLVRPLFAVFAAVAVAVLLLVPRRLLWAAACIAFVGAVFLLDTAAGLRLERDLTVQIRRTSKASSWVDQQVGTTGNVGYVWTGPATDPNWIWQTEFWNSSIRKVYYVNEREPGTLPAEQIVALPRSGDLRADGQPLSVKGIVSDRSFVTRGRVLATVSNGLSLARVTPVTEVEGIWTGLYSDGWTAPRATYEGPGCRRGSHVDLVLASPEPAGPQRLVILAGAKAVVSRTVAPGTTLVSRAPLEPARRCTLELRTLPGWSPSEFGSTDPRRLGFLLIRASSPPPR